MIVGVAASATNANMSAITLPVDRRTNGTATGNGTSRYILTAHTYSPFGFTFISSGAMRTRTYSRTGSGHSGPERINFYFGHIATAAARLGGIPVILGEWGAEYDNNNPAREVHAQHYVELARARGWVPILWCNGSDNTSGERFGFLNRSNNTFRHPGVINAIMRGAGRPQRLSAPIASTVTVDMTGVLIVPQPWLCIPG